MTKNVVRYLRAVARWLFEGEPDRMKDKIWDRLTQEEKDRANRLVRLIFGPWL